MQESWRYLVHMASYSPFCPKFRSYCNEGQSGVKFDWQHSLAHLPKPPYKHKNFADISYTRRVIAYFVPNVVRRHGNGIGWEKMRLAAFNGSSPKTLLPSYSQFCPKFRCHGNRVRSGKNGIGSI